MLDIHLHALKAKKKVYCGKKKNWLNVLELILEKGEWL